MNIEPGARLPVRDMVICEGTDKTSVERFPVDFNTLAEDTGQRAITSVEQNLTGCVYVNPAVTVSCPSPCPHFFQTVRKEQAKWCQRASHIFPKRVRRRVSRWQASVPFQNRFAQFLDRALCFTGILFINGEIIQPHRWCEFTHDQS